MTHEPSPPNLEAAAYKALVVNLRNAHAVEKQIVTVLEAQVKQLTDFPDLQARLTEHIAETREQARRLESGLEACGESTSRLKDTLLSIMGLGQSSVQSFTDDAVLKAVTADMMTEHLEIATYRSLIVLADMAGKSDLRPRLEESLREEQAMAEWFDRNLERITRRFVEIKASEGQDAGSVPKDDARMPDGDPPQTLWQTLENAREANANQRNPAEPGRASTPERNAATVSETPRHSGSQEAADDTEPRTAGFADRSSST